MKIKTICVAIFALFLQSASSKNFTQTWNNCSMTDSVNSNLYNNCTVYVTTSKSSHRYVMCMPWADPNINPICTLELINPNKAIYSTQTKQDTTDIKIHYLKNEKTTIQIIFPKSTPPKPPLTITLNDIKKCGLKKH